MKENSIEDRINNAYCFLNSMHSDFRTGLYYKEDLENLEHILSDYKRVLKMNEVLLKENEELKETYKSEKKMKNEYVKLYQDLLLREEVIPVQKVKDKIEEIQKEYNKLDKQIDEYINDVNKDLAKYYENKEKISIMQTLSCFIDTLQELLKESE